MNSNYIKEALKAQKFVILCDFMDTCLAVYKVYGVDKGDQVLKLKQSELNFKPNYN